MRFLFAFGLMMCAVGVAQAGAWEEFERRCLVPMENVQDPVSSDFELMADDNVRKLYRWSGAEILIEITNHKFVEAQSCGMGVFDEVTWHDLRADYRQWRDRGITSGTYEINSRVLSRLHPVQDAKKVDALSLQSTDWREPKLRLRLIGPELADPPFIFVEDTDLES